MYNLFKSRKITVTATFLIIAFFAVPNANGQWVNVGLFGRSSSIVVSGSNLFAFGKDDGAMNKDELYESFYSIDSGASWNRIGNLPDSIKVFGLQGAVNSIIFEGGGSNDSTFRSTDYGKTWSICSSVVGLGTFTTLGGNGKPVMIFASTYSGVYYSSDTGNSWIAARDSGLNNTTDRVATFTMFGGNLYAGEEFSSGIFVSSDSGNSWAPRSNGLPAIPDVTSFVTIGTELFAGIALGPSLTCGVFLSTDSGNSWKSVSNGLQPSISINALALNGNTIFAGAWGGDSSVFSGVYLSSDNGMNWLNISEGLTDSSIGSLAVADGFLFAATDSGIWRRPLSDFNQSGVSGSVAANSSSIQLFPNPSATHSATIEYDLANSGPTTIELWNILGEKVQTLFVGNEEIGHHSQQLKINPELHGSYFVKVISGSDVQTLPICVE